MVTNISWVNEQSVLFLHFQPFPLSLYTLQYSIWDWLCTLLCSHFLLGDVTWLHAFGCHLDSGLFSDGFLSSHLFPEFQAQIFNCLLRTSPLGCRKDILYSPWPKMNAWFTHMIFPGCVNDNSIDPMDQYWSISQVKHIIPIFTSSLFLTSYTQCTGKTFPFNLQNMSRIWSLLTISTCNHLV
jgi:hypothetical protein